MPSPKTRLRALQVASKGLERPPQRAPKVGPLKLQPRTQPLPLSCCGVICAVEFLHSKAFSNVSHSKVFWGVAIEHPALGTQSGKKKLHTALQKQAKCITGASQTVPNGHRNPSGRLSPCRDKPTPLTPASSSTTKGVLPQKSRPMTESTWGYSLPNYHGS